MAAQRAEDEEDSELNEEEDDDDDRSSEGSTSDDDNAVAEQAALVADARANRTGTRRPREDARDSEREERERLGSLVVKAKAKLRVIHEAVGDFTGQISAEELKREMDILLEAERQDKWEAERLSRLEPRSTKKDSNGEEGKKSKKEALLDTVNKSDINPISAVSPLLIAYDNKYPGVPNGEKVVLWLQKFDTAWMDYFRVAFPGISIVDPASQDPNVRHHWLELEALRNLGRHLMKAADIKCPHWEAETRAWMISVIAVVAAMGRKGFACDGYRFANDTIDTAKDLVGGEYLVENYRNDVNFTLKHIYTEWNRKVAKEGGYQAPPLRFKEGETKNKNKRRGQKIDNRYDDKDGESGNGEKFRRQ